MNIRKLFSAAVLLVVPVLLHPFSWATAEDMWLVWSDYSQDGNPVGISHLTQGEWRTEKFSPGEAFDANFSPALGLDNTGDLWVVWARRPGWWYPRHLLEPPRRRFLERAEAGRRGECPLGVRAGDRL